MKVFKKLTSVFLSFMMIVATLLSYGVSNNVAYAVEGDDSTLALPVKIYDAHMDGFVFEYKNSNVFGDNGSKNVTKGLVEDTLTDGKMVYKDTATGKSDAGLRILASNIQTAIKNSYSSQNHPYPNLFYALKGKLESFRYKKGSRSDLTDAFKKSPKFEDITTCYHAAYWMTYYMFRDGGEFSGTYNNKTYTGVLTKNFDIYDKLVLNKQSDGSYSFSATLSNEHVLYDETDRLIKNDTTSETRGGFFPLNNRGFAQSSSSQETYNSKNYAYTLESSGKFVYNKEENLHFDFKGDDDVYLFINNKLALDIGGQHEQIADSVYLEQECTASDASTGQTWAEYLGLEEGNIYDFNFFYIERHTTYANMEIKTNIHVYDPEAVPQKNAYVGDEQIPYGGYVAQGTKINYEFVLTNAGKVNIKNLTFVDDKLKDNNNKPLSLSKDNITLNSETNITDLTVFIGSGNNFDKTEIKNEEELKQLLANGIKVGQTIKIKGFNYTLGSEKIKNVMSYTAESEDGKIISGDRDNIVIPVASSDKAFIIDFGKPVTYTYDKVFDEVEGSKSHEVSLSKGNGNYGTMTNNTSQGSITYKLTKFMEGIDTFKFDETIKTVQDKNEIVYNRQTNVKMVPGTSIYYEDNFGDEKDEQGNITNSLITYGDGWTIFGEETINKMNGDGTIGYDEEYDNKEGTYSGGTVHGIVASKKASSAKFDFTGTGIDIYSYTSAKTDKVQIRVKKYNANGTLPTKYVYNKIIYTKYSSGESYQLPVSKFDSGTTTPARYQVTITIPKGGTFYLDGFRIYNPIGNSDDAYGDEKDTIYYSIREQIEKSTKFNVTGKVFIDSTSNKDAYSADLSDDKQKAEYILNGRKTEVCIAPNESVTIELDGSQTLTQIGARINGKAPTSVQVEGLSGKVLVNEEEFKLSSSTDMYYNVIPDNNCIKITNETNNIISLTNLKMK